MQVETRTSEADASMAAAKYTIDASRSTFTVQAFAAGMLSAMGHNPTFAVRKFSGEINFAPNSLEESGIVMNIDAESIELTGDINDKDRPEIIRRMRDEVLEVDRFSKIVYRCDHASGSGSGSQFWVTLNGMLSLHGVTQQQVISTSVNLDGNSLRASGNFSVKQTDFDVELVSALGGAIRVKDEVKFAFDIMARTTE
jgi:polyisoprenoid-binding protein YceI